MTSLDTINATILQHLASEGRISNQELAQRVGLSASACLRRVQELERSGVVRGYRAVIDPSARGAAFTVYVTVRLSERSKPAQDAFERAMSTSQEVCECHSITGEADYLLRVEVRDLASFRAFCTEVLGATAKISAVSSQVVLASPKDLRA